MAVTHGMVAAGEFLFKVKILCHLLHDFVVELGALVCLQVFEGPVYAYVLRENGVCYGVCGFIWNGHEGRVPGEVVGDEEDISVVVL